MINKRQKRNRKILKNTLIFFLFCFIYASFEIVGRFENDVKISAILIIFYIVSGVATFFLNCLCNYLKINWEE